LGRSGFWETFMALPSHVKYVIVGAGIHGLSTAWHLGENLRKSGKGSGKDILVIDKSGIAAGASGIACGVVRNNYFQPAMRRLMAHSVSVWGKRPGSLFLPPGRLHAD
jgi:glycine/D-amino acid oxidase-like deaminating enzyme